MLPPGRKSVFTLNGASDLRRTLYRANVDIRELKPINREAAEIVKEAAQAAAPVESGRLASTLRIGATNKAGIIRAGNNRARNGVAYAGMIHWGWPDRGIESHPFIASSARKTEPRWHQLYERYTNRVLSHIKGV